MRSLLYAVDTFLAEATVAQKWRIVVPVERNLRAAMGRAFQAQARAFLRGFARLRGRFQESITEPDWVSVFDDATGETAHLFLEPLNQYVQLALLQGAETVAAELDIESSLSLSNPRAVAYLHEHGFGLIARIDAVTRGNIATIIGEGVAEGWSYGRMATEIRSLYVNMSRKRAELIAVTEAGNAYEAGANMVVSELADAGLRMQKAWLTVGDNRVSEGCRANEAEGWIPFAQAFNSGHQHPLRFPGCRCTTEYRRER